MIPRVERALLEGVGAVEELGLRYAIVGGLAMGAWGVPRATRDVDLYVELALDVRGLLEGALVKRGFEVPAMEAELQRFGVFRSKLKRERVFLDIFDAVGPLGSAILDRRKKVTAQGRALWFVSAEDLAVLKAFSDRARDHDDLVSLFAVPKQAIDVGYVERWAKVLDESIGGNDVSERLARALDAADRRRRRLDT